MDRVVGTPGPSQSAADQRPVDRETSWTFVLCVWALTSVATAVFIYRFNRPFPSADEWMFIPVLTGRQPVSVGWLWELHNEHRVPLLKLIYLAGLKLASYDFRVGPALSLTLLSGLSLALATLARKVRGRSSYTDAFFTLTLLSWSNMALWWGFSMQLVLSTALASLLLGIIVDRGDRLTPGSVVLAGCSTLLMPLCGMNGLVLAPFCALWLGCIAKTHQRLSSPLGKRMTRISSVFAAATLLLMVFYFVEYHRPVIHPPSPDPYATLQTGLLIMAAFFGSSVHGTLWPLSGLVVPALLVATLLLLREAGKEGLARIGPPAVWPVPSPALRRVGLLILLSGATILCLGVGWARAGLGILPGAGAESQYHLIPLPALFVVYFVALLHGKSRRAGPIEIGLFLLAALLFAVQVRPMVRRWVSLESQHPLIVKDLQMGMTPALLAQRRMDLFAVSKPQLQECIASYLGMLRDKGIREYRLLQREPACRETPLWVQPKEIEQTARVWMLRFPRFVHAVKLRYSYPKGSGAQALFRVFWADGRRNRFEQTIDRHVRYYVDKETKENTMTVQIDDTIDRLRIDPDVSPCQFQTRITLLLPERPVPTSRGPARSHDGGVH